MLRVAIVEPNKERREYVRAGVQGMDLDAHVTPFGNEYDFLESLDDEATSFDVLLLNTTLRKRGDGIELASKIRTVNRRVMICFITDSEAYYAEAFSVFATGYLLYPFDIGELHNCISFYHNKTKVERRASWMIKEKGSHYRRIFCRNIVYIESANREIRIHMEDGSVIESYCKMDEAMECLSPKLFLRCHQSYIISLYFVDEMKRDTFFMRGEVVPISRKYKTIAKDAYYDYMFEKM